MLLLIILISKYEKFSSILILILKLIFPLTFYMIVTSMLEVSSSKPLANESKGFIFCVELVTPSLPSVAYLSCVVCTLLHKSEDFTPSHSKCSDCGFL